MCWGIFVGFNLIYLTPMIGQEYFWGLHMEESVKYRFS